MFAPFSARRADEEETPVAVAAAAAAAVAKWRSWIGWTNEIHYDTIANSAIAMQPGIAGSRQEIDRPVNQLKQF